MIVDPQKSGFVILLLALFCVTILVPVRVSAQTNEPELRDMPEPKTYQSENLDFGVGFHLFINNFGFGLGAQYRRVVGPYSQITATLDATGVRDVSEQRFQFFDQQVIPNKYKRVLGVPMLLGYKHRFFPHKIDDNFRLYGMIEGGAMWATIIPYFFDANGNGLRDVVVQSGYVEPINDMFEGWESADSQWGAAGRFKIGVDFGEDFKKLSSVEFGYNFYYFPQGIQMMQPKRAKLNERGEPVVENGQMVPCDCTFNDPMFYFGTPQISLVFGSFW